MKIFPAIDVSGGRVVRLTKGDYNRKKVYADSPEAVVRAFKRSGASCLHAVDLDGAKDGSPVNPDVIRRLTEDRDLFVEVGGGIRDEEKILTYLAAGAGRVILGTVAVRDFDFTRRMIEKYGERIAVGVDARDGLVAVSGWLEKTDTDAVSFCERLRDAGLKTVIYTDIARDGMLAGCNLAVYERLCKIEGLDIVASGGICSAGEIRALRECGCAGAIIGKALYEGSVTLEAALAEAEG